MDKLMGLSKGNKLILGGGVLLFIDTFLPWQKVSFGIGGASSRPRRMPGMGSGAS